MKLEFNMSWIIGAICFVVGGGVGGGLTWRHMDNKIKNMKPVVVREEVASKQQDIIINLTEPQLVKDICEKDDPLICRLVICLQFTRGMDSQTAGKQCEEISNLINSIDMLDYCKDTTEPEKCLDTFYRRK